MTLCHWVWGSWHFDKMLYLCLQGSSSPRAFIEYFPMFQRNFWNLLLSNITSHPRPEFSTHFVSQHFPGVQWWDIKNAIGFHCCVLECWVTNDMVDLSQIAREHGIRFMETSAKANINIDRAFNELAEAILDKTAGKDPTEAPDRVLVDKRVDRGSNRCC